MSTSCLPPQVSRTLWAQQLEEGQRSPVGGGAEPGGVCWRAAVGVSVRSRSSLPAEAAAVVVRLHDAGCGRPGSLRDGPVRRRPGRRRRPAAFTVLRSVCDVDQSPASFKMDRWRINVEKLKLGSSIIFYRLPVTDIFVFNKLYLGLPIKAWLLKEAWPCSASHSPSSLVFQLAAGTSSSSCLPRCCCPVLSPTHWTTRSEPPPACCAELSWQPIKRRN